jgi:hypothetical protein
MSKKQPTREITESKNNAKVDYTLAVFLIFLGGVLLLNTTGMVEWNVWSILWRFWPVLIVFAGLNLIFEGSKAFSISLATLLLAFLSLLFLWSSDYIPMPTWLNKAVHQEFDSEGQYAVSKDEYVDVQNKEVKIDMSVGSLDIFNDGLDNHLHLDAEYFQRWGEPDLKSSAKGGKLDVLLNLGHSARKNVFWNTSLLPKYSVLLGSDDISTELFLKLGAGQTKVFLDGYNLSSFTVESGAGDTSIQLANMSPDELNLDVGAGNLDLKLSENVEILKVIDIKVGVGRLVLQLPKGVGYDLEAKVGVGALKTPEKTVSGIGNDLVKLRSKGYDDAENTVEIVAEVGVGELVIK